MIRIEQIDTTSKKQAEEFVEFHYQIYKDCPQWTPPFKTDIRLMLNREKHPFYEHSDANFYSAYSDGKMVGRLAIMENRPFNKYHNTKKAQFYLFDGIDDQEVFNALFDRACEWCKKRGLDEIVGPKGFYGFDGYGVQVEGFENRQMMNMMTYNYAYYKGLFEKYGFEKEVDFVSCYLHRDNFKLPEQIREIARRVLEKGNFQVKKFKNKRELISWAWRIGEAYNKSFINNWEYYPQTQREIQFTLDNIMVVADPKLIKIITYKDEVAGFAFGFPDISAAMKRHGGNLTPWAIADMMIELKRTKWISFNGIGVLPQYHGRGGNYLMFNEMVNTVDEYPFIHYELTQVAETAVQMRRDLENIGSKPYKNHRIFHMKV